MALQQTIMIKILREVEDFSISLGVSNFLVISYGEKVRSIIRIFKKLQELVEKWSLRKEGISSWVKHMVQSIVIALISNGLESSKISEITHICWLAGDIFGMDGIDIPQEHYR